MKNLLKSPIALFILMGLSISSVYAAGDLNRLLKGTYAQNEQWACNASTAPFQISCPDCWTEQITAAGEITYNGDGTAYGEGRGSYTNTANPAGDIFTYSCDWTYTVNPDRTFMTEGQCLIYFCACRNTTVHRYKPEMVWTNWKGQENSNGGAA